MFHKTFWTYLPTHRSDCKSRWSSLLRTSEEQKTENPPLRKNNSTQKLSIILTNFAEQNNRLEWRRKTLWYLVIRDKFHSDVETKNIIVKIVKKLKPKLKRKYIWAITENNFCVSTISRNDFLNKKCCNKTRSENCV